MCKCFFDKFNSEGNEYVKKLINFRCKCKNDHLIYVLFCKEHPYVSSPIPRMKEKCECATAFANDICDFCIQVKYLLYFKCYKFCLERILVSTQDELITASEYFKTIKGCEPFFYFNGDTSMVFLSLDNPLEPKIKARTDYIYF